MTLDCGVQCVALVLRLLDRDAGTFGQLRLEVDPDVDGYADLASVARVLESRGVRCRVIYSITELEDDFAIGALRPTREGNAAHFVVLRKHDSGAICQYEPPVQMRVVHPEELERRIVPVILVCEASVPRAFGAGLEVALIGLGTILIVCGVLRAILRPNQTLAALAVGTPIALSCCACEPLSAPGEHGLRLHPSAYRSMGPRTPGTHEIEYWIANETSEPKRIVRTTSSCGCAGVELDRQTPLAPGERRACRIRIAVEPKKQTTVAIGFHFEG